MEGCFVPGLPTKISSETAKGIAALCLGLGVWIHPVSASVLSENTLFRRYVVTSGEALLRYALPLGPEQDSLLIRKLQRSLENIEIDLRSKGPQAVRNTRRDISESQKLLAPGQQLSIAIEVPKARRDQAIVEVREAALDVEALSKALDEEVKKKAKKGVFDRSKLDVHRQSALNHISTVEVLMSPTKLPFRIPKRYDSLPRLTGRATIELEVEKFGGSAFLDAKGNEMSSVTFKVVADGYSAPLSAGDFVDLVDRGFYNGLKYRSKIRGQFLLTEGEEGFNENGKRRDVPLEYRVDGDEKPLWGESLDQVGYNLQLTLPPSAFGAIALSHSQGNINNASAQLCFFLQDPRSMPARSMYGGVENGNISTFGYVIENQEYLSQIEQGDIIKTARVTEGLDRLEPGKSAENS